MKYLIVVTLILFNSAWAVEYRVLSDMDRNREIPVQISYPLETSICTDESQCPVAFLSSGYGVPYDNYLFITDILNKSGFLVVAVQHELPGDPPLAVAGNLFAERSENWRRGADTLKVVREKLKGAFSGYNFEALTFVGHSNGGDISAWIVNEGYVYARRLITLDHRRVPLPRTNTVAVLSIRGSDFAADDGVLYTPAELKQFAACVVHVEGSEHNDMTDRGPEWLKGSLVEIITAFLAGRCYGD